MLSAAWVRFINGHASGFPEEVLQATYRHTSRRLEMIHNESLDPQEWPPVSRWENDIHHWLNRNPVSCEGLVLTMLGAPMPIYHGGLLHAQVSYYDEDAGRPGLPPQVADLVEQAARSLLPSSWNASWKLSGVPRTSRMCRK